MYYRITNGQVEQVTSLPNVSGVELYLQSLPVNERQSMGIFSRVEYGAYEEPSMSHAFDCIYAPMPIVTPVVEHPFAISKIKLDKALLALGARDLFDAFIASDKEVQRMYDKALVLISDDPNVIRFRTVCLQAFGFTPQEIDEMLQECKSDL